MATDPSNPKSDRLPTYAAFWPYYLQEHRKTATRAVHYVGTVGVFGFLFAAIALHRPLYLACMPLCGYGFAWFSHFFIEKNRPATFTYPLWSLGSDFRMFFLAASGKLGPHLRAAGIGAAEASQPAI